MALERSTLKALLIVSGKTQDGPAAALRRHGFSVVAREQLSGDVGDCDLVAVHLDHPDQFSGEHVRRLLGGLQGRRLVCVRGTWCASMLRSRGDWPAAVVVDAAEFEPRLIREAAVLRGAERAMPMTAGLEEIAAWKSGPALSAVGRGKLAMVESRDVAYREMVIEQLKEAGFEIASKAEQAAELCVFDADSMPIEERFRSSSPLHTVLVTASPDAVTATGQMLVASKFEPVGQWLRRLSVALIVCIGMLTGCQKAPSPPAAVDDARPAWGEQVKAVRAGTSNKIAVSKVSSTEWKDLATDCDALEVLEIDQASLAPAELEVLLSLSKLRRLKLGSGVDDAAADVLGRLAKVTQLLVNSDSLTDRGVAALCRLPLVQLRLRAPKASDAAAAEISKLEQLRFLHLIDVPLTDAALPALAKIKNLESLYLDGAKCSDDSLSSLLKERPDIHFHRDQSHLANDPRNDGH